METTMETKIIRDGILHAIDDDGAIHAGKPGEKCGIVSARFAASKNDGEVKITGTRPGIVPDDVHWLEISTQKFGAKRSTYTTIYLEPAQIRRLRDLCNIVLGEESIDG